jgi:asparagine synthase (glutamine-hydrolysing)
MCGIAGIWLRSGGGVNLADIERMLATIIHRGPDGSGLRAAGRVGLGHRRLAILDMTERASQPMATADGQGLLVYNGETYNYGELRRELESEGLAFRSSGDTEVVLAALHHWGPEKSIPRFNGMFALAYFDRRNETLWLARDRLGIKTLVTADTGNAFLFASEAKGLLAHPDMPKRLDLNGLTKWIIRPQLHAHRLLFECVEPIAAGSWWRLNAAGIHKHRYFHVLTDVEVDRLVAARKHDPADLVDKVERLIERSVELHLASDVPLATLCSGGVDSSLLTACARENRPGIHAYVADISFARTEAPRAERVGRHLGVEVRRVSVDQKLFLRLWPVATWHSDGPLAHRSDPALLAVTRTCRKDGIKVLLTGEGSDELFGGYDRHQTVWRRWRRKEWPWSLLPVGRRRREAQPNTVAPFEKPGRLHTSRLLSVALDPDDDFLAQRILRRLAPIEPASDRTFIAYCLTDLYGHLATLLHRHDRIGMAASIEMRVPFLENHLIDFAIHLPRWAKLRRRTSKWLVKQAAVRRLPEDVVFAAKEGFPTPGRFLRGTSRLLVGGRLADTMRWSSETTEEIVAMLEADGALCFHVVSVELWLRIFFYGEPVDELGDRLVALAA